MTVLYVRSISVWTPRFPSRAAWRARSICREPSAAFEAAGSVAPAALLFGARARGRASILSRMLAEVVAAAASDAGLEVSQARLVLGSAFGEMETTAQLLKMMHEGDGALSPARFQSSVHNTAAGLLSIATSNREASSCLAAGDGTAAALLLEAKALLAEDGGEVLVAMADERLPGFFANNEGFEPAGAALVVSSDPQGALASLGAFARTDEIDAPEAAAVLGPTPVAPLLALIDAIEERRDRVLLPAAGGALRVSLGSWGP